MFNIGGTATIHGEIDIDILCHAFTIFADEHDSLRMRYTVHGGQPFQYFCSVNTARQLGNL